MHDLQADLAEVEATLTAKRSQLDTVATLLVGGSHSYRAPAHALEA